MNSKFRRPRFKLESAIRVLCLMLPALALAACGSSKSSGTAASYSVGGTISGLTAGSVVLVYNGSTTVTVAAGATTWTFAGSFPSTESYSVSVASQPAGELCEVTSGGNGAALTANIVDIVVTCSVYGQWTWQGGSQSIDAGGVYGTRGAASASNFPGARYDSISWTDSAGNLWLFGGLGYDSTGLLGALNDLWQYSPSTGLWTWVDGTHGTNSVGVYGALGTAAAGNLPGARYSSISWIDSAGNLWLFGGLGYDASGKIGRLNDLWRFSPSTGLWTWINGSNTVDASAVYGTVGTAAAGNVPGARDSASSWIDSAGNLWLLGGAGYDSTGAAGSLNDLWQYTPGTGLWTWIGGSQVRDAKGVYGTQATATAGDVPGARQSANTWVDASGTVWLFGGYGYDSNGGLGYLNDFWQYAPSTGLWTWIGGSNAINAVGVYGTHGTAAAGNVPGARQAASSWITSSGNLWLFGGSGVGPAVDGALNDLWEYSPATGQWTWISGSNATDSAGSYGKQGSISASAGPGAREAANAWIDPSGDLWLFGGAGHGATGDGYLNDLWQFTPP
jgi:N-acetylneuraminic acid mutarotase